FPRSDAVEVHLSTDLQQTVLDHPRLPKDLRAKADRWVEENRPSEGSSVWGPLKRDFWDMPPDALLAVSASLEDRFRTAFTELNIPNPRRIVAQYVRPQSLELLTPTGA